MNGNSSKPTMTYLHQEWKKGRVGTMIAVFCTKMQCTFFNVQIRHKCIKCHDDNKQSSIVPREASKTKATMPVQTILTAINKRRRRTTKCNILFPEEATKKLSRIQGACCACRNTPLHLQPELHLDPIMSPCRSAWIPPSFIHRPRTIQFTFSSGVYN